MNVPNSILLMNRRPRKCVGTGLLHSPKTISGLGGGWHFRFRGYGFPASEFSRGVSGQAIGGLQLSTTRSATPVHGIQIRNSIALNVLAEKSNRTIVASLIHNAEVDETVPLVKHFSQSFAFDFKRCSKEQERKIAS